MDRPGSRCWVAEYAGCGVDAVRGVGHVLTAVCLFLAYVIWPTSYCNLSFTLEAAMELLATLRLPGAGAWGGPGAGTKQTRALTPMARTGR